MWMLWNKMCINMSLCNIANDYRGVPVIRYSNCRVQWTIMVLDPLFQVGTFRGGETFNIIEIVHSAGRSLPPTI